MVYLRKKKGMDYLYLVKSVWDKNRHTSRQITIKYLGESSSVTRDDIPPEFCDDPRINTFLLQNTPKDRKRREEIINQLRSRLFSSLTEGNLNDSVYVYQSFISKSSIEQFYEKILTPIMEKVGAMWADGRLSIATEHIASNTAQSLIKLITENHKKKNLDKGKILVTTPAGEEHCIPCNLIESFLLIEFIKTIHPTAVLISITLLDNIKAGQRLAKKINEKYKRLPVYVGGQALNGTKSKFHATIIQNSSLEQIPKILTQRKK